MLSDNDLTAGLTALAARAHPSSSDPEGLLRLHTLQQRRRVAVRGSALMAVTASGVALTLPHLGGSSGRAGLGIGSGPTPVVTAASECPGAPDPVPTPLAPTPAAPAVKGPQPTPAPRTPPPMPEEGITARITHAVDGAAPVGVTRACDLTSDLLYRAGGTVGPIIDVAASAWTGPLPALDAGSRVTRQYANGDEYRSTVTAKGVKVALWSGGDLITWSVEPSSAITGARVEDLEGWADRVHAALG